jgi:hypothetical protein
LIPDCWPLGLRLVVFVQSIGVASPRSSGSGSMRHRDL